MIDRATAGALGWSSRGELRQELAAEGDRKAPLKLALARIPIERLPDDSQLLQAAVDGGRSAFKVHCVQCHGSGATGSKGYANLNDDDWLWGGNLKEIHATIDKGVRQPELDGTHMSMMPAFGRDGLLQPAEIQDVVSYVRTISRQEPANASARRGATLFASNCAACHGPDGRGKRDFGAPNLTDSIWLYGGDRDTLIETVTNSRYGVMPAWGGRLDPVTVKMLAAYVHSLGGGEQFVPARPAAAAPAGAPQPQGGPDGSP
jgi:cytochrome c oxidase cbb3-type subunit 3